MKMTTIENCFTLHKYTIIPRKISRSLYRNIFSVIRFRIPRSGDLDGIPPHSPGWPIEENPLFLRELPSVPTFVYRIYTPLQSNLIFIYIWLKVEFRVSCAGGLAFWASFVYWHLFRYLGSDRRAGYAEDSCSHIRQPTFWLLLKVLACL